MTYHIIREGLKVDLVDKGLFSTSYHHHHTRPTYNHYTASATNNTYKLEVDRTT